MLQTASIPKKSVNWKIAIKMDLNNGREHVCVFVKKKYS